MASSFLFELFKELGIVYVCCICKFRIKFTDDGKWVELNEGDLTLVNKPNDNYLISHGYCTFCQGKY